MLMKNDMVDVNETITVRDLKRILSLYNDDYIVELWGGQAEKGDFACLAIHNDDTYDIIMRHRS